jgi:hypothetical protein
VAQNPLINGGTLRDFPGHAQECSPSAQVKAAAAPIWKLNGTSEDEIKV